MKKTIIISTIIFVIFVIFILVFLVYFKNDKKKEIEVKFDDVSNWDYEINLPLEIDYDYDKNTMNLYIKDKIIQFEKDYQSFDSYKNVSKNHIVFNAVGKDNNVDLYIVDLNGNIKKNLNQLIVDKDDKIYSGYFEFENDSLRIFYVSKDMCFLEDDIVNLYIIKTRNDLIELNGIEYINKSEFLKLFTTYCDI